jgi:hypothetical protein
MRSANRAQSDGLPRGIFILPNIFTTLNLFCGFYAAISIAAHSATLFLLNITYVTSGPLTAVFRSKSIKQKQDEAPKTEEYQSSPV